MKIHFHTDAPQRPLKRRAALDEIYSIAIESMAPDPEIAGLRSEEA